MFRAGNDYIELTGCGRVSMPLSCFKAKQSVATMEGLCQKLQQTHFLRGSGGLRGPTPKMCVVNCSYYL